MFTPTRILGAVILCGILFGAAAQVGISRIFVYLSVQWMVFVLVAVAGILLLACKPADWLNAGIAVTRAHASLESGVLQSAANWLRCAGQAAMSAGVVGFLFHLIHGISSLYDHRAIGVGLVTGFMPLLYGAVFSEFLLQPLAGAMGAELARRELAAERGET